MNEPLDPVSAHFFLSFLFAAGDYVFPKLRLASMEWTRNTVDVYYYIDGLVSDDNEESLNLIGTYFGVDRGPAVLEKYSDHIIRVDYPEPIVFQGQCVYARKESPPVGKASKGLITERWLSRFEKGCIAIQRAMVGNIFPQIRNIVVNWDNVSASVYFRVHGELSEDDRRSIDQIVQYFRLQFPKEEMTSCDGHIIRIDFPDVPKVSLGTLVYARQEYSSLRPREPYEDPLR